MHSTSHGAYITLYYFHVSRLNSSVHAFFWSVELLYNLFTSPQAAAEQSSPWATSTLGRELLIQVFIFLLLTFLGAL